MANTKNNKNSNPLNGSALIIQAGEHAIIGKQQQAFNTLITTIGKLQAKLLQTNVKMDRKLAGYVRDIIPLEASFLQCTTETVRVLYWHYNNQKTLTKNQRSLLEGLISKLLDDIFDLNSAEPTAELKEIFEAVEGQSYDEFKRDSFDEMKENFSDLFKMSGFDIDLDDLKVDMTEEEVIKKTAEMREKFNREEEERAHKDKHRKKSKKELAQEAKEKQLKEARTKNISSIYKQLAKIFHPDLEQNPDLKQEKEELMKQLTSAYNKNDLHTLLSLELAFIHKEEKNRDSLTDEKLKIYNEVLREQVYKLTHEIEAVYEHPKYYALHKLVEEPFYVRSLSIKNVQSEISDKLNFALFNFNGIKQAREKGLAHVKKMIKDYKFLQEIEEDDDFSFFRAFKRE